MRKEQTAATVACAILALQVPAARAVPHAPVVPKSQTIGGKSNKAPAAGAPQNATPRLIRIHQGLPAPNADAVTTANKQILAGLIESIKLQEKYNQTKAQQLFNRAMSVIEELPGNTGLKEQLTEAFPRLAEKYATSDGLPPERVYVSVINAQPYNIRMGFSNNNRLSDASQIERILKAAIADSEKEFGRESENTVDLMLELCALYGKQARYAEQAPYAARIGAAFPKLPPAAQKRLAIQLLDTAAILSDNGRSLEAAMFYTPVTKIAASVTWSGVDELNQKIERIARSATNAKYYEQAETLFKTAVALREHSQPEDPLKLASERRNLAQVYESQRKYGAAEELYKMALADEEKSRGADNAGNLPTLVSMAKFYLNRNKPEEARRLLPRIMQMAKKPVDPSHSYNSTNAVLDLATDFGQAGDAETANRLIELSYASRQNSNSDYQFRQTAEKLARAYQAAGKPEEAEKLLTLYVKMREETGDTDNHGFLTLLFDLARFYIQNDQIDRADAIVARIQTTMGEKYSRNEQYRFKELAEQYVTRGHFDKAEQLLLKTLGAAPPKARDDLNQWLQANLDLAGVYLRDKKRAEAQVIYERVAKIVLDNQSAEIQAFRADVEELIKEYDKDKDNQQLQSLLHELVNIQHYRGREYELSYFLTRIADRWISVDPARAERMYKTVLDSTKQKFGEEDRHYTNALSSYVSFLYRAGNSEEAQNIQKKLVELQTKVHKQQPH